MTVKPNKAEIKPYNGAPTLFINGSPNAGMTYNTYTPHAKHFASFGKIGVDLVSVSVTADFSVHFGQPTAWPAPDQYDFSDMDGKMKMVLDANPNAYVFPRIYLCSPPWWDEQHPDQLVKWDDGSIERTIGRKTKFPSWASEEYRQASANNLRRFIEHVRTQWYADRVIGYHIASGMWEEWFYWSTTGSITPGDFLDYSEPMLQAFRKWLANKYLNDRALQQAWSDATVTLSTARIPTKAERQATDRFVWRDPTLRRHVIDYYLFSCVNVTEIIELLARTVKEAVNGEQLVGVFYGYMFFSWADEWQQNNGHLALRKLLECPDIDFLTAPSAYAFRELGTGYSTGQAATDAVRLHGKYYMDENDYHTHLLPREDGERSLASNFAESEALQLRELGNIVTRAWGTWWFDMGGGWYDEPEFMHCIEKLNAIGENSIHFDRSETAEIAVVVDEDSIFYTGLKATLMKPLMYDQILFLGRIGAPFDWVFQEDIDMARPYKFYIFLNAFHVNHRQKHAIDRLASRGAKGLLWLYGAGFAGERSLDVKGCTELTGIEMAIDNRAGPLFVTITREGADMLSAADADARYGSDHAIGPLLYPNDPEARVLGTIETHNVPGLVVKSLGGMDVYYSAAPTLPSSVLRGMASKAGVHIYHDGDDVIYANQSFLSLHTGSAGVKHVRLPRQTDVYDVYNEKSIAMNAIGFDVELPANHTVLYFLGSETAWKAGH